MRALRGGARFHGGDVILHRFLDLLEGPDLDLPDTLTRNTELVRELFERDRVVRQPSRLEDAPLALVEHVERLAKRLVAVIGFFTFDQPGLLAGGLIDQPILPFAG